jgi:hypothetical protein
MISRAELELALVQLERYLPFLRRHLTEFDQSPSPEHRKQAFATLRHCRDAYEQIDKFLSKQRR